MRNAILPNLCGLIVVLCVPASAVAQARNAGDELLAARTAFAEARSAHADASAAVSRAEVARMRLERSVEVEYLGRPDLLALKQIAGAASIHYNALRNAVLDELREDPDFQRLKQSERDAATALATAKENPQLSMADEMPLAHALMQIRKEISRFEAAAMALDPSIEEARIEMNQYHDAASKLELSLRRLALRDERLKHANDEVTHARSQLVAARATVATATQRLMDAEKRESMRNAGRRADPPRIDRPEK